jgi:hypothetical protein
MAYIDPISGSVFFQAIIAGVLGALVTMKGAGSAVKGMARRVWRRLKG